MLASTQLPYSRQGLENLAMALNKNSALICFDNLHSRIELKHIEEEEEEEYEE